MALGKRSDRLPSCSQAVAAGGGEVAHEIERFQRINVAAGDLLEGCSAEEVADASHEPSHDGRIGIAPKVSPAIPDLANEPDDGHAAADAIGFGAIRGRQGLYPFCPINHSRQPLLRVLKHREVFREALQFFREEHAPSVNVDPCAASSLEPLQTGHP